MRYTPDPDHTAVDNAVAYARAIEDEYRRSVAMKRSVLVLAVVTVVCFAVGLWWTLS